MPFEQGHHSMTLEALIWIQRVVDYGQSGLLQIMSNFDDERSRELFEIEIEQPPERASVNKGRRRAPTFLTVFLILPLIR